MKAHIQYIYEILLHIFIKKNIYEIALEITLCKVIIAEHFTFPSFYNS